ncbi:hypothetical protein [Mycolicibacterium mengxianglii]|nr:hypothetical protein [Mycolicibacterium mengxianglii]
MSGISPLIVRIFDDPHAKHRRVNREGEGNHPRFETKGRVRRRRPKRTD